LIVKLRRTSRSLQLLQRVPELPNLLVAVAVAVMALVVDAVDALNAKRRRQSRSLMLKWPTISLLARVLLPAMPQCKPPEVTQLWTMKCCSCAPWTRQTIMEDDYPSRLLAADFTFSVV
jgi:hypothetical protein